MATYEDQGTDYDPQAVGHEKVGRASAPLTKYHVEVFEADAPDANGEVLHMFVHEANRLQCNDLIRHECLGQDAARVMSIFEHELYPGQRRAFCVLSPFNG